MCAAIACAYVIFGMAGFGTALVASPVLACLMPVAQIVPLLALMDCSACAEPAARWPQRRPRRVAARAAVAAGGQPAGAALLLKLRADLLPPLLGLFVSGYALWSLAGKRPAARFTLRAALPFGLFGGVCSAMFGSGGFLYAIYLSGRRAGRDARHAVDADRCQHPDAPVAVPGRRGLRRRCPAQAGPALAPAMMLGLWAGRRITLGLSREQFLRMVNWWCWPPAWRCWHAGRCASHEA